MLSSLIYLSGCVTEKQKMLDSGMKPSTNQELKSLFTVERTAKWNNIEKDRMATVTWLPDGSQSILSENGTTFTGTYSIEKDEYCSKLDHRGGEVKCSTWFKIDDYTYRLYKSNGSLWGKLTFQ